MNINSILPEIFKKQEKKEERQIKVEEVIKDLNSLMHENYFVKPLGENDTAYKNIMRRSFNDLYDYYKTKGVSEEMLMEALMKAGIHCYFCSTPMRFVFFKNSKGSKCFTNLLFENEITQNYKKYDKQNSNVGIYTSEKLLSLYDSIEHKL